ncbi:MAG: head protein [Xanthobacteraceae bacterium]|nr:MAG: head protein [Xanthobacteraceae bacterium]
MGALAEMAQEAISTSFYETLSAALGEIWSPKISVQFDSKQATEKHRWLGFSPALREWVGGRQAKSLRVEAFSINNVLYEWTLDVEDPDWRRGVGPQIKLRAREGGLRAAQHWNTLAKTLLNAGESGTCYDGAAFFSAAHASGASGTQINLCTASHILSADVATAAKPTAAEAADVGLEAIGYMQSYKDDVGEIVNENAKKFLILCPTARLFSSFFQAFTLQTLAAGAESPAAKAPYAVEVQHVPTLTSGSYILLCRMDGEVRPLIAQEEEPVTDQFLDESSTHYVNTNTLRFGVKTTRGMGYGEWRHAMKVTLS